MTVRRWRQMQCVRPRRSPMKPNSKVRVHLTDQMVLIGFGLAAVYWILDTFMSLFLSSELNLFEQLFGINLGEISTRLIVLCLFIIFGSHAQTSINKFRSARNLCKKKRNDTAPYSSIILSKRSLWTMTPG